MNYLSKFSYLKVYQVKHHLKIFQKRFPRFLYNFHLIVNNSQIKPIISFKKINFNSLIQNYILKHESFLFFNNYLIYLDNLNNFFSGLDRKPNIYLKEFLSLKESIQNFGSSFKDKS